MSKDVVKHNATINDIDFKIIEVGDKYIVAKPINPYLPEVSGAHICFNTGYHHFDHFDGRQPLYINQYYNQTGSIFITSGSYVLPLSVQDSDVILLPKKPISEMSYLQKDGNLQLSVNANGWVVALAKNKDTIEEVKTKVIDYVKENIEK